jgi:hypothetical protein
MMGQDDIPSAFFGRLVLGAVLGFIPKSNFMCDFGTDFLRGTNANNLDFHSKMSQRKQS